MSYEQYSLNAFSGYPEDIKHRVSSNSASTSSEDAQFPTKFDVFVNKENSSLGGYSVIEQHTLGQFVGSTLYLDHRPSVDTTGGISSFSISNGGVIDPAQTDVFAGTVQFTTLPSSSPFTISYNAVADKVQDSHINALQNTVMAIQSTLGVKTPVSGLGSGLVSFPIFVNFDPQSAAELSAIQAILPNIVLPAHLSSNYYLGSSDVAGIPGYGTTGITLYIGNPSAVTRNNVWIDADQFTLATTNGTVGGLYVIGNGTGDAVNMSGNLTVASRTVIGMVGGALGQYQSAVPTGAAAFYSGAMLAVHGGIWFGSGLSGNGSVTFIVTSGEAVDVEGALLATTLTVSNAATFNGTVAANGPTSVSYPGYFYTNNDITLNDKPDFTPAKIDGLDPSYAKAVVETFPVDGCIIQSVRYGVSTQHRSPYVSGAKSHPLYGYKMYPMLGGWTYTGTIAYEAAKVGNDKNILLLNTNISGVGTNSTTNGSVLGSGLLPYGHYATGLFNPGDTFIEIKSASAADAYSYPIYYHKPYFGSGGNLTGLNVYVAADDAALQSSVAGKTYRLYQPGNVPMQHLTGNFTVSSAPFAHVGNFSSSDYPNTSLAISTERAWLGGNNVSNNNSLIKRTLPQATIACVITEALQKNIGYTGATPPAAATTGVAYIYMVGDPTYATREKSFFLKASPTPFGIASAGVQTATPNIVPGQHIAVGEIVASTSDGVNWAEVESVSYRENGMYDSCWVPLVDYIRTSIPSDLGRCLPFYGSTKGGSSSNAYDNEPDVYDHQFYVEHNLGPIQNMGDLSIKVYIANYGTNNFDLNPAITGAYGGSTFRSEAQGAQNLWTPHSALYNTVASAHSFASTPQVGTRGFLKDISKFVLLRYIDTRFALLSIDVDGDTNEFLGKGNRKAGYIRVIMRKQK